MCVNEESENKKKRQQAKSSNNNNNKIICRRSKRSSRRVNYCDAGTSPMIDRSRLQAERTPPENEATRATGHIADVTNYRGPPIILAINKFWRL